MYASQAGWACNRLCHRVVCVRYYLSLCHIFVLVANLEVLKKKPELNWASWVWQFII